MPVLRHERLQRKRRSCLSGWLRERFWAADDLLVGAGLMDGAGAQQRLEACERGAAAVVPEDELVEVDLQVLGRGAVVGSLQPGLEVGERAARARQHPLAVSERARCLCGWWSKPAA